MGKQQGGGGPRPRLVTGSSAPADGGPEAASVPPEPSSDAQVSIGRDLERMSIEVTPREVAVVDEVLAALSWRYRKQVFRRAGEIVRVVNFAGPADRGVPMIQSVPKPALRTMISDAVRFLQRDPKNHVLKEIHPPSWCVDAVYSDQYLEHFDPLEGVVDTPVLRPDGTLLEQPDYDPKTGLLYVNPDPRQFPAVALSATREEAREAAERVLHVVVDFPFAGEEHRAAWLAALMTPIARPLYDGPTPFFLFDKNVRGAGGSKLADIISLIVQGREMPRSSNIQDDDEARKVITTYAMNGRRMVLIDNITGRLGTPSLDAALTSTSWSGRVLGTNREIDMPMRAIWYGTGNNVQFNGDTERRTLTVRIESKLENPEDRTNWTHPHLFAHVGRLRGALVSDILTILVAYMNAGMPEHSGVNTWGSFEGWSRLFSHLMGWLGFPDPQLVRKDSKSSDGETLTLDEALTAWRLWANGQPKSISDVMTALKGARYATDRQGLTASPAVERLRAAIEEFVGEPVDKLRPRVLAARLKHFRNRVVGGYAFAFAPGEKRGASGMKWVVAKVDANARPGEAPAVDPGPDAGGEGGTPPPASDDGLPF
jgi:hypothetical protein